MAPEVVSVRDLKLALPAEVNDLFHSYYRDTLTAILSALSLPPNDIVVRIDDLLPQYAPSPSKAKQILNTLRSTFSCDVSQLPEMPECVIMKTLPTPSSSDQTIQKTCDITNKVVVVDRMCGEAVVRGSDVFAPGVLGCTAGVVCGDTVDVVTDCKGLYRRGRSPEEFQGELIRLGRGTTEMSRKALDADGRKGLAVRMTSTEFGAPLPSFERISEALEGHFRVVRSQSLPSMVVARVLVADYIRRDSKTCSPRILDMCAAPGGKTTHMASLLAGKCQIVACERSRQRALKLLERCTAHTKATSLPACITCVNLDSTKALLQGDSELNVQQAKSHLNPNATKRAKWKALRRAEHVAKVYMKTNKLAAEQQAKFLASVAGQIEAEPLLDVSVAIQRALGDDRPSAELKRNSKLEPESFDCVLLDGPCSALGLRPRLAIDTTMSLVKLESFAKYQRRLLDVAVKLIKPGGVLVYSTCTINPLENEGNVAYVLKRHKELSLESQQPYLGKPGLPGFELTDMQRKLLQRFEPTSPHGSTNGFFCAKFRKASR